MTPNFRDALGGPAADALAAFDAAAPADLSAFDAATRATAVPAGWYACTAARGELVTTRAGQPAYRLALDVADGPHRGFRLWRYYTLDTPAAANRAKAALAPLGLATGVGLKRPFPGPGRVVTLRVLVGAQTRPDGTPSNDVERFTVESDVTASANPNAVSLDGFAAGEGGTP